jgi:hypothetical protein
VNVALPALLHAADTLGCETTRERAIALYRAHPGLQPNHKTRWVEENVLARTEADAARGALVQQGMLGLYDSFCAPRRCPECPLLAARGHL